MAFYNGNNGIVSFNDDLLMYSINIWLIIQVAFNNTVEKNMDKVKVMSLIWSMGDGGAQQVLINYLRDFKDDPDIDFRVCVYTEPTKSKYDRKLKIKITMYIT